METPLYIVFNKNPELSQKCKVTNIGEYIDDDINGLSIEIISQTNTKFRIKIYESFGEVREILYCTDKAYGGYILESNACIYFGKEEFQYWLTSEMVKYFKQLEKLFEEC